MRVRALEWEAPLEVTVEETPVPEEAPRTAVLPAAAELRQLAVLVAPVAPAPAELAEPRLPPAPAELAERPVAWAEPAVAVLPEASVERALRAEAASRVPPVVVAAALQGPAPRAALEPLEAPVPGALMEGRSTAPTAAHSGKRGAGVCVWRRGLLSGAAAAALPVRHHQATQLTCVRVRTATSPATLASRRTFRATGATRSDVIGLANVVREDDAENN